MRIRGCFSAGNTPMMRSTDSVPLVTLLTAAAFLTPFRLKKPTLPAPAGSPVIAEQEEEAETDRLAEAK